MNVHEPATLLTDLLLAALTGWLAWRLHRPISTPHPAVRWWSLSLAVTAASALVGGAYHGFAPNFPPAVQSVWWTLTLLLVSLISAAMAMSLLFETLPVARHGPWQVVIAFKFLAFSSAAIKHPEFVVVIIDYGLTMLVWSIAAIVMRRRWRGWLLVAVGLSVVAAAVQRLHWSPMSWFNHNDLYHVIQAFALVAFYRAGRCFAGPPHQQP
jgi:hypothetical protein